MTAFETAEFRAAFTELLAWRRDVRRFRTDPLPDGLLQGLVQAAALAPSVGLSQPWRFVRVKGEPARAAVRANFARCNADALAGYQGDDARLYAELKLAGLDDAPEQLAVFCDRSTAVGRGLGRRTMPETLDYSVVAAVHGFWLAARTYGVGVGWVSILDPEDAARDLAAPEGWKLIAYLCVGFPETSSDEPELQRVGWERRQAEVAMVEL